MRKIIQYPQEQNTPAVKNAILALEETAWKPSGDTPEFPSAPNTYVTSFVLMENCLALSHGALRKSLLLHKGEEYLAYGLSEIVTRPEYQRQGLGSQILAVLKDYLSRQTLDLLVFTCAPDKASFYQKAGFQPLPGACLVGGTKEKPFRSDSLGLVTLACLCSEKAICKKQDFENTDLLFYFGEGQLW